MSPPWVLAAAVPERSAEERSRFQALAAPLLPHHPGWALLSTCHRVELYGLGPAPDLPGARLLEGEAAVRRLFRVAAGLESAVVGENEVLHQVRQALAEARERSAPEPGIARLLESAIAVGRRVRGTGTPLAQAGLAERAVGWLGARTVLAGRPLLVAGTGVMGAALARAGAAAGALVTVAGRNPERADVSLERAAGLAPRSAAVAVALGGAWPGLGVGAPRLPPVADISYPMAVPPAVRERLGPDFLGVDGLYDQAPGDSDWGLRAARLAEEGAREYLDWLGGRRSLDAIQALRARAEARRQARVERLLRRLPDLSQRDRELLVGFSRQLVTDLLHEPLTALRTDRDGFADDAARRLHGL